MARHGAEVELIAITCEQASYFASLCEGYRGRKVYCDVGVFR